jgi:transcription elongation factor Elf1
MKKQSGAAKNKALIIYLPCLRCGKRLVAGLTPVRVGTDSVHELSCDSCEIPHLLGIKWLSSGMVIFYNRFTGRYQPESYDDPLSIPIIKLGKLKSEGQCEDSGDYYGVIVVQRRQKYFSKEVLEQIWQKTDGKCHICGKFWELAERGQHGWHIDHKIAHSGGGENTEWLVNFYVACASCNLRKGTGIKQQQIRKALKEQIANHFWQNNE